MLHSFVFVNWSLMPHTTVYRIHMIDPLLWQSKPLKWKFLCFVILQLSGENIHVPSGFIYSSHTTLNFVGTTAQVRFEGSGRNKTSCLDLKVMLYEKRALWFVFFQTSREKKMKKKTICDFNVLLIKTQLFVSDGSVTVWKRQKHLKWAQKLFSKLWIILQMSPSISLFYCST